MIYIGRMVLLTAEYGANEQDFTVDTDHFDYLINILAVSAHPYILKYFFSNKHTR